MISDVHLNFLLIAADLLSVSSLANAPAQFQLFSRHKGEISNIQEWRDKRQAVNKGWVPGKSAWETANAWVGSGKPVVAKEFRALLNSHELTSQIAICQGIVEHKTPLRYSGGPRNHDLLLCGQGQPGLCVIGVESKADDGFDGTMQSQIQQAQALRQKGERSNRDLRANWLSQCILGVPLLTAHGREFPCEDDQSAIRSEILALPFQLFAGVAATMLEASTRQAKVAVFAVHQFRTTFTNDAHMETDGRHLDRFVSLIIGCNSARSNQAIPNLCLDYGSLVGPVYLMEREYEKRWTMAATIPLLIGKVLTDRL